MNKLINFKSFRLGIVPGMIYLAIGLMITACTEPGPKSESEGGFSSSESANAINKHQESYSINQDAVNLLRGALNHLSNLKQFSVQAQSTLEDLHPSGHRVDYEIASSVIIQRPDKLRSERHSDLFNQIFYYNGKTLTLYNPLEKVYATEPAPATIEEMFHFARDTHGLSTPVTDILYKNSFDLLIVDVFLAEVIGKEMIGEVQCDHLLFSRPGVDFQIWIPDNGDPLPLKYIVTDTSTPELLAFVTVMRNWDTNPSVSETMFEFVPEDGIFKIEFLEVE